MKKGGLIVAVLVTVMAAYAIATASTWDWFQAKAMPIVVSGFLLLLGLNQLRIELKKKPQKVERPAEDDAKAESASEQKVGSREQWKQFAVLMGWCISFLLGAYLLGFLLTIGLFSLLYIRTGGQSWRGAFIFALVAVAFTYFAFAYLLSVQFPVGKLTHII